MRSKACLLVRIWATIAFSLGVAVAAPARTIYVDANGTGDYPTIQAAIDAATDGDTVILQPGTYTGDGNRDIDYKGKAITVRSTNPHDPNIVAVTIIDCHGTEAEPHRGFRFHSREGSDTVIAGLTISNGYGQREYTSRWANYEFVGGAIFCFNSNPTITQCKIEHNEAGDSGGGIWCDQSSPLITDCVLSENSATTGGGMYNSFLSNPALTNCTFSKNSARGYGGGTYNYEGNPTVTGCTFSANSASGGGGAMCNMSSSPTITNCTFSGNSAREGGGMHNARGSPVIVNCTLIGNSAGWYGGGMYDAETSVTVTNCQFSGNSATVDGGGIYGTGNITNCIITDNTADDGGGLCGAANILNCIITSNTGERGGGVYCWRGARIDSCIITGNTATSNGGAIYSRGSTIRNCTISGNTAGEKGGAIHCDPVAEITITNCVLWFDYAIIGNEICVDFPIYYSNPRAAEQVRISYTNIRAGHQGVFCQPGVPLLWLDGNTNVDPLFVDGAGGDFHLLPDSLLINAGDPNYSADPQETDIDGQPRLSGGRVDIGAYEFQSTLQPFLAIAPTLIEFSIIDPNEGTPECKVLLVRNTGTGSLNWTISYDCDWLKVIPTAGVSSAEADKVTLSAGVFGLTHGRHSCALAISDPCAVNSPRTIPITLYIGPDAEVPNRFPTIQEAIDSVRERGTVVVADGVYTGPGNRDIDFKGKAITVRSQNGPANCVIDCQGTENEFHRGFHFHSREGSNSVLEGFTITNGHAESQGGAILCTNRSSPTIRRCIITNNMAGKCGISERERVAGTGGGICCAEYSNAMIDKCTISHNGIAANYRWEPSGGGIFCQYCSPIITNCTIIRNSVTGDGGGLFADEYSNPDVTECTFSNNKAYYGGGLYLAGRFQSPGIAISNCIIHRNEAVHGGGVCFYRQYPKFCNCLISANTATDSGGGISCSQSGALFTNCTVADNDANHYGGGIACGGGGGDAVFQNCMLWANTAELGNQVSLSSCMHILGCMQVKISHSCIQTGPNAGFWDGYYEWQLEAGSAGNIDLDPLFVDPNASDYHLKSQAGRWEPATQAWIIDEVTSPCIDAGDPLSPIGHEPFPNGGRINMGAYGGTAEASKSYFGEPVCETIVAGDINGDCRVDLADFAIMALHWLEDHRP